MLLAILAARATRCEARMGIEDTGLNMRTVFLDKESLPIGFRRPRCASEYQEYAHTAPEQVVERLAGATIAIINKVPLRAAELAQLPQLRLIALAATGYDCVDVEFCRARQIAVTNVRRYAVHTLPEHVFALMLALRRNIASYTELAIGGEWQRSKQFCVYGPPIHDLHGSVLGIVGYGSVGRAVATLGTGFGMRVRIAASPAHPAGEDDRVALRELLAEADVLSLHCPLTAATRGLIGASELRAMKPTAILINTARGGLVDEAALAEALRAGWIAGAGFDVLSDEPPAAGNVLLSLRQPNFILTPHVAWASDEAMRILADQLTENIEAWAAGVPRNLVT
jgi:glycerate dehydrogenase